MTHETFRAGVGAVILDARGRVLAFERADLEEASWQLPQGGLDAGESPEAAVYREVQEETGLTAQGLELLGRHPEPLAYVLPAALRSKKTGRGQVHDWFYFRLVADATPALPENGEFRAWRAMPLAELAELTAPFRRPVYRQLLRHFDAEIQARL